MIFIVLVIAFIVLSLWLTSVIAKALGAGNASISSVFIAGILTAVVMFPVGLLISNSTALILINMAVAIMVFAKVLELNIVGAFVVYLANGLIWGGFFVAAFLLGISAGFNWANAFAPVEGDADIAAVERSAEDVCVCGVDEECIVEAYIRHAQIYTDFITNSEDNAELSRAENYSQRADACADNPAPYRVRALTEAGNTQQSRTQVASVPAVFNRPAIVQDEVPDELIQEQARTVREEPVSDRRYREVNASELALYQSKHVRITRKDQQQFVGFVTLMENGDARLLQRRRGGEFGVIIPRRQVAKVEVLNNRQPSDKPVTLAADSG